MVESGATHAAGDPMISDVLSEALAKIEHYQADPGYASIYAEPSLKAQIEDVKRAMQSLRAVLVARPEVTGGRQP